MAKPISGNNGNDTLSGLNGSGRLAGGNGEDTYIIDDAGDEVVERRNGGTDHVTSYISYQLPGEVENLTLLDIGDLWGSGNELDNVIVGNSGANELKGFDGNDRLDGGDGDDRLFGGDGDDTLTGGRGSDLLDGGAGADIAIFAGVSTDYGFEWEGDLLRVTQLTGTGAGEMDQVTGVEYLQFDDGIIETTLVETTAAVNEAPVAADDLVATLEDTSVVIDVLANDSDADGDALGVSSVGGATYGTVAINADGTLTYTPNADYHGADSFFYTIGDGNGNSATASVTLDIEDVNDAPIAVADAVSVAAGQTFTSTVAVLANDHDPDDDVLVVETYDSASAMGGAVSMAADGSYSYTPAAGFIGTDSFSYSVSDGNGGQATADVTVTVEAAPDPDAVPYYVEALLAPNNWNRLNYPEPHGTAATVTFAFAEETPSYYDPESFAWDNFQPFSAEQQEATRQALEAIENYSGLTFVEAAVGDAEMVFGTADLGYSGFAFFPSSDGTGNTASDVWIDDSLAEHDFIPGTSGYKTLIHEIGHAIGLTHPDLPTEENTYKYTVMTAYSHPTMDGEPHGYMLYDVAAIQHLYGPDTTHALGDDSYGFGELNAVLQTIWDAGGHDVLDLSSATFGVSLDLRAGHYSTVAESGSDNLAIAFGTTIEDAIGGAYADRIIGNEADNRLTGGGGSDVFEFAADWGDDTITDFFGGEDSLDFAQSGLGYSDLTITSSGGNTTLAYGDDSVTLIGVETIDQGDFLLA